jgi:hypothetical protein
MSYHTLFALLAPTCILLLVVAMIVHDKIIDKRMSGKNREPSPDRSDKSLALEVLKSLPPGATFDQILTSLRSAWVGDMPEALQEKLFKVFASKKEAVAWLTTRQPTLNNALPIEILRISAGEQLVLEALSRIETANTPPK